MCGSVQMAGNGARSFTDPYLFRCGCCVIIGVVIVDGGGSSLVFKLNAFFFGKREKGLMASITEGRLWNCRNV